MSSFIGVKWKNASYGTDSSSSGIGSLKESLSNLSCVKENVGDKPVLLFVESSEVIRKGSKKSRSKTKDSKQKIRSRKVYENVFLESKLRVQIASQLFTCIRMDVSNVKTDENPYLCSAKAPLVAVYTKDGSLKKVISGAIKAAPVFSAMKSAAATKDATLNSMLRDVYKVMDQLYKNEVRLYDARSDLKDTAKKYSGKKNKSAEAKIKKATKVVSDIESTNTKIKEECNKIAAKYKI